MPRPPVVSVNLVSVRFWVVALDCGHEVILVKPDRIINLGRRKRQCPECGWQHVTETFRGEVTGKMIRTSSDRLRGL